MNAAFLLVLLGGCVSVAYGQVTCPDSTSVKLQDCADTFNNAINMAGSNSQAQCQAARTLLDCFYNQDACVSNLGFQRTKTQADGIQYNYPCTSVMSSVGRTAGVYVTTLTLGALAALCL